MGEFVKVTAKSEVPANEGRVVEVKGKQIALFNVNGKICAIDNTCVHRGGPLGEGSLEGNIVTCPWHGWQYDVASGACLTNPAASQIKYDVKVEGNDILIST